MRDVSKQRLEYDALRTELVMLWCTGKNEERMAEINARLRVMLKEDGIKEGGLARGSCAKAISGPAVPADQGRAIRPGEAAGVETLQGEKKPQRQSGSVEGG